MIQYNHGRKILSDQPFCFSVACVFATPSSVLVNRGITNQVAWAQIIFPNLQYKRKLGWALFMLSCRWYVKTGLDKYFLCIQRKHLSLVQTASPILLAMFLPCRLPANLLTGSSARVVLMRSHGDSLWYVDTVNALRNNTLWIIAAALSS